MSDTPVPVDPEDVESLDDDATVTLTDGTEVHRHFIERMADPGWRRVSRGFPRPATA